MLIRFTTIIFVTSLLAACATLPRQAITPQDKMSIGSTRILLNSTQREITMQHNNWFNSDLPDPYNPMDSGAIVQGNEGYNPNAGLLGAVMVGVVQHHQAGTAINAMAPVREVLENFDFLNYFNLSLRKNVASLPWLKVTHQEVKYNVQGSESKNAIAVNENATLFVGTTYALNSAFRQLEVVAYVKLVQRPIGSQTARTLYANNFFFVNRLPEPNGNTDANKEQWLKNDGLLLKTKLRDAASVLSQMIAMDIENPNGVAATSNGQSITVRTVDGLKVNGKLIKQQNSYYIIVLNDSTLYVVNSGDFISKS